MLKKPKIIVVNINNYNIDDLLTYTDKLYKKDRIDRFKFNDDKVRSIISEMLIRTIYCETTNKLNKDIVFCENKYGKPFIKGSEAFCFNVAHSYDFVTGVFDNEDVGVDIEAIQGLNIDIAKSFCTDNEYNSILQQDKNKILESIISIWVLKESYMKYLGTGLSESIQSFDVITKENIPPNVMLHKKKNNNYILGICSKKQLDLDNCIEELSITELLKKYKEFI